MEVDSAEYKAEYDKAVKELDEAEKSTTSRGPDGKFTKAEAPAEVKAEVAPAPAETTPDPLEELRAELAKTKKIAEDNQAWGTRNAQELAALKKEREQQARDAQRPKILDANPDLAEAIRYVAEAPKQEQGQDQWNQIVASAHPGIFDTSIDPDLLSALVAKRDELGQQWQDPIVAIREITTAKLAHAERAIGKRFAAESARLAQKSAMSVPGAGATSVGSVSAADDVDRIRNMSNADFEREVRKVKGY